MHYRGQLFVEDEAAAGGLPVDLVLMDRELAVEQGGVVLGKYPLSETSVQRIGGERFHLTIGSESLIFSADDALAFSYEGLPFIAAGGSHPASTGFRRAVRKLLKGVGTSEDRPPLFETVADSDHLPDDVVGSDVLPVEVDVHDGSALDSEVHDFGPDPHASVHSPDEPIAPWLELVDKLPPDDSPVAPRYPTHTSSPSTPPSAREESHPVFAPFSEAQDAEAAVSEAAVSEAAASVAASEVRQSEVPVPEAPLSDVPVAEFPTVLPLDAETRQKSPTAGRAECSATLSDGSPCPMEPLAGRALCFSHVQQRDAAREQVVRRSQDVISDARQVGLPDLDTVINRLEHAVAQVHDGQLDPKQALAMASLVQAMVDTIELGKSTDS